MKNQSRKSDDKFNELLLSAGDNNINVIYAKEKDEFRNLSNGVSPKEIAENILCAFDEDYLEEQANMKFGEGNYTIDQFNDYQQTIIKEFVKPFSNPKLRDYILKINIMAIYKVKRFSPETDNSEFKKF